VGQTLRLELGLVSWTVGYTVRLLFFLDHAWHGLGRARPRTRQDQGAGDFDLLVPCSLCKNRVHRACTGSVLLLLVLVTLRVATVLYVGIAAATVTIISCGISARYDRACLEWRFGIVPGELDIRIGDCRVDQDE
jgi:hypothetical protein